VRYVVVGAGAIGGVVGGFLHLAGCDVTLVARGEHLAALQAGGLRLLTPEAQHELAIPAVGSPAEATWTDGTVALLAVKSQDTEAVLAALGAAAPPDTPVVCMQNGVENERRVLRRFAATYAVCVMCPATHVLPGVVVASSAPTPGLLDIGCYPSGTDATAASLADELRSARFESVARTDIMRWKYRKLLMNLLNAVEALCGPFGRAAAVAGASVDDEAAAASRELVGRVRDEGDAVLAAAGIEVATPEEDRARRGDHLRLSAVAGEPRGGGSSWQSLRRGTGSIEADYLNGEIVLLGWRHGVPTPANELLRHRANEAAASGAAPGSVTAAELLAQLDPAPAPPG
jgi:2-dehydropantoate 2-reductase